MINDSSDNIIHDMKSRYAVLQETNEREMETWLYFIKYEGNENNLENLKKQLESFDWFRLSDCSIFDIDNENLVSAQTAKQMTKLELNSRQWHRKFDGKLEQIDFGFKKKDSIEKKISKVYDLLACGQIENYIDDEDIDEDDLESNDDSDDDSDSDNNSKDMSDGSDSEQKSKEIREPKHNKHRMPGKLKLK